MYKQNISFKSWRKVIMARPKNDNVQINISIPSKWKRNLKILLVSTLLKKVKLLHFLTWCVEAFGKNNQSKADVKITSVFFYAFLKRWECCYWMRWNFCVLSGERQNIVLPLSCNWKKTVLFTAVAGNVNRKRSKGEGSGRDQSYCEISLSACDG